MKMTDISNDSLWEYFVPVWRKLEELDCKACLIGGYALALKQRWLISTREATLIGYEKWPALRVTQDLDVVFPIKIIGDQKKNPAIHSILASLGWIPLPPHENWTYAKNKIKFEIHTPVPPPEEVSVTADARRVKPRPKPHTGESIHGTPNAEAVGFDIFPTEFFCPSPDETDSVLIRIPNPLSLCMMKIISAEDRYRKSLDEKNPEAKRELQLRHARKHAGDVVRTIAMTLRSERDRMDEVLAGLKPHKPFKNACEIFQKRFVAPDGWARLFLRTMQWEADDVNSIIDFLSTHFSMNNE